MGFKAGIWASRLGFGPRGWDLGLEADFGREGQGGDGGGGEEGVGENFSLCENIGHRPLRGRCPKKHISEKSFI